MQPAWVAGLPSSGSVASCQAGGWLRGVGATQPATGPEDPTGFAGRAGYLVPAVRGPASPAGRSSKPGRDIAVAAPAARPSMIARAHSGWAHDDSPATADPDTLS